MASLYDVSVYDVDIYDVLDGYAPPISPEDPEGVVPSDPTQHTRYLPTVITDPTITYDFDTVRNAIEVLGYDPEGKKPRVRAVAVAQRSHPLSPWRLARNGEPRFMAETIENTDIKRESEAREVAERELKQALRSGLSVGFEALVIPHLEPGDVCTLKTRHARVEFSLDDFTIPLSAEDTMTVGALKRKGFGKVEAIIRSMGGNWTGRRIRKHEKRLERQRERRQERRERSRN